MAESIQELQRVFRDLLARQGRPGLKSAFATRLTRLWDPESVFEDCEDSFSGTELADVAAELCAMLTSCSPQDFAEIEDDHLDFLIELAGVRHLSVPSDLVSQLPPHLHGQITEAQQRPPGCPDEDFDE